ncbi:MAG: phosphocholine cytidylyltransferase family protein [Planctomycetota bacterium]|jgi:phosphoenolpyruvate phosphomutase
MSIDIKLTEEQRKFLQDHPEFNLQEWFNEVLNRQIKEMKIEKETVRAVIAAAGYSVHITQINSQIPTAMLKIKGKTLLERQIEILHKFDIKDITVVRGYKKESFTIPDINYIDNEEYESTGILYSFFLAVEKIIGKTILLYGDILFEIDILKKLIQNSSDFAVVVDKSWRDHYHDRVQHPMSEAELVEVKDGAIVRMGRDIPYDRAYGEFIGLSAVSSKGAETAKNLYRRLINGSNVKEENVEDWSKASLTDFFNALIAGGEVITCVDISGGWLEIDTFEDYRRSWTSIK